MNITNWKQKLYSFLPQMLKTSWISSKKRPDKKRFKLYVFPEIYRKLQKDPDYLMFMNDKVLWGLFDWYNYFAFIGDYNKRVEKTTEKIVIYIYIYTLFPVTVCWNLLMLKCLKIAELDCCQIIILKIYVPSTHD